jgi:anti-anti-sigma factor
VDAEAGRTSAGVFAVELVGGTLIVTAADGLGEFAFREIEAGGSAVLARLGRGAARNVVVDLRRADYCGSTALGFFARLWKRVRECNGRMALCGVSDNVREILAVTRLCDVWPVYPSKEEALGAVGG